MLPQLYYVTINGIVCAATLNAYSRLFCYITSKSKRTLFGGRQSGQGVNFGVPGKLATAPGLALRPYPGAFPEVLLCRRLRRGVEGFALRRHVAEQLRRGETLAVFLREGFAFRDELRDANGIDEADRAARIGREAEAHDAADVAVLRLRSARPLPCSARRRALEHRAAASSVRQSMASRLSGFGG